MKNNTDFKTLLEYLTGEYFFECFYPLNRGERIVLRHGHNEDWRIGLENQEEKLDIDNPEILFNKYKLDLLDVNSMLYMKSVERAAFAKRRYDKGVDLFGQGEVDDMYDSWNNFGKELAKSISDIIEDNEKEEEKKEKRKRFTLISNDDD